MRALGFLAGLVALAASADALAQSSCIVDASERAGVDCMKVDRFAPNKLDVLLPNNTLHLIPRATTQVSFRVGPQDHFREVIGFGFIGGVAPLSSQALRLSLGADLLFGRWAGDHGAFTLQPTARVAFLNRSSWLFGEFIPSDFFFGVVLPTTFGALGGVDVGGELGIAWRPANFTEVTLSGQAVYVAEGFTPDGARSPVKTIDRIQLSVGFDVNSVAGLLKKPVQRQTHADLRCPFFKRAVDVWRSQGGTQRMPAYCAAVNDALKHLADGRQAGDPLQNFWKALHVDALQALAKESDGYDRCVEKNRREQRACVDCANPGLTLKVWFAYTLDPYQAAAALGCQEGTTPTELLCADDEPALSDPRVMDKCN